MLTIDDLNLQVEEIAGGRHNRPGTIIRPTHVTIHNTDNSDAGADAHAHSSFVRDTGYYILRGKKHWVSWHFSVDDHFAIRHLPVRELAFHAGPGNAKSVAIEICMNQGINQAKANSRAALLAATLLRDLGIPVDHVVTHKSWTGKTCPTRLLDHATEGAKWHAFLGEVKVSLEALQQVDGPTLFPQSQTESITPETPFEQLSEEALTADIDHELVSKQLKGLQP